MSPMRLSIMNMQKGTVYCISSLYGGLPMEEKMCLLCDKYNKYTKWDSLLHVIIIWGWGLPMENVPPMR